MQIKDVTEVKWMLLSGTLLTMELLWKRIIHTLEKTENADTIIKR